MLRFLTLDARGKRLLDSGILDNVQVTPDTRANALVLSAPPECMELLEALIQKLDQLPAAEAQVRVFTIVNGDAQNLTNTLMQLFSSQPGPTGGTAKRFEDMTPNEIVPTLAEEGLYIASESSFYRILKEKGLLHHRFETKPRTGRHHPRELEATGPEQVWSWDITYLPSDM